MRSAPTLRVLSIGVAILLLLVAFAGNALGETMEGSAFSAAVAVTGGVAIGAGLILALGARRSRS